MGSGKWVRTPSGSLVALDRVEQIAVIKDGGRFVVAGWVAGAEQEAFFVLFSHPDGAICDEWLREFARHLQVTPKILFGRPCPECLGVGEVTEHDEDGPFEIVCDTCEGAGSILIDPAEIEAKPKEAV